MYIDNQNCNICKKSKAVYYRCLKNTRHYFICDSKKCNFLSLLKAGMMKLRNMKTE